MINRSGLIYFPEWQQKGQDLHPHLVYFPAQGASTITLTGTKIFIRKNKYDVNRAMIIIYNRDHSLSVAVNVSGILSDGNTYELHNSEDYFGDMIKGRYKEGNLIIPMSRVHTVAKPIGI